MNGKATLRLPHMNELPHLTNIFDRLKRGCHLGPDDEPEFSVLCARSDEYADYFAALGLTLVRHERDFFYFEPDNPETVPDTLPRIAVFSYIIIDHAANQGRPIEEFIFGQNFLVTALPHFTLDRYTALLRQVDVHGAAKARPAVATRNVFSIPGRLTPKIFSTRKIRFASRVT